MARSVAAAMSNTGGEWDSTRCSVSPHGVAFSRHCLASHRPRPLACAVTPARRWDDILSLAVFDEENLVAARDRFATSDAAAAELTRFFFTLGGKLARRGGAGWQRRLFAFRSANAFACRLCDRFCLLGCG